MRGGERVLVVSQGATLVSGEYEKHPEGLPARMVRGMAAVKRHPRERHFC